VGARGGAREYVVDEAAAGLSAYGACARVMVCGIICMISFIDIYFSSNTCIYVYVIFFCISNPITLEREFL
jgi:hypothetical protein